MNDFTQTKLINNLIDLVAYFYETKHKKSDASQIRYLKGFCEGIAHTLVEAGMLESEEAKSILKGLGKKRTLPDPRNSTPRESEMETLSIEDLDIPTIFRKQAKSKGRL